MGWNHIALEKKQQGSKKAGKIVHQKHIATVTEYTLNPKICRQCSNVIEYKRRRNKFCSSSCGTKSSNRKRWQNERERQKQSERIKQLIIEGKFKVQKPTRVRTNKICEHCYRSFETRHHKQRYCSRYCSNAELSKNLKGKCGGIREGSGRGKSGWYSGYFCNSSYELAWVIYHVDHNIPFKRNTVGFSYIFSGSIRQYYPDFKLPDGSYVEIKGFKRDNDQSKWDSFPYPLTIVTKKEMQPYFQYTFDKTGLVKENLLTLYDDFVPEYSYTCTFCEIEYKSNKLKKKLPINFCSRICSGKFRKQTNIKDLTEFK